LHEKYGSFEVMGYNEFSQMATFSITDEFIQGDTGLKADIGLTGSSGDTGIDGDWGYTGPIGDTGYAGITGISFPGITGPVGETGPYVDTDVLLYYKFKTSDPKLIDFSPYERDSYFYYTGVNDYDNNPLSYFIKESGPVDYCHDVVYGGGLSEYRRGEFFEFGGETGTLSVWVKLTEKPVADFTYTIDNINPLTVHFFDASGKRPTSWKWWMEYDPSFENLDLGDIFTAQNPVYSFPGPGTYVVKLRAININGFNEISKFIEIV
jgi:hypothetical protein